MPDYVKRSQLSSGLPTDSGYMIIEHDYYSTPRRRTESSQWVIVLSKVKCVIILLPFLPKVIA